MKSNPVLVLMAAWLIWAGGFLLLYTLQAVGCSARWDNYHLGSISALRLLLIATTVAIVLILLRLSWRAKDAQSTTTLARIGALSNGAAIVAALCFSGVFWLRMCA